VRGEFLDLGGARLYYYAAGTRGAGGPVVFLHGFPTSSHLWNDVVPLMPAGHRLVVVDLLGYGRSDRPLSRPVDIRAHGARIIQLLDELRIPRACIVGHGIGGGIAQSLAIRYRDRVSHLCPRHPHPYYRALTQMPFLFSLSMHGKWWLIVTRVCSFKITQQRHWNLGEDYGKQKYYKRMCSM
jgi:pimeloyl-ACP methyl ester carboxylesterase